MHGAYEGFHCPACCVAIEDYKTLTWERDALAARVQELEAVLREIDSAVRDGQRVEYRPATEER